MSFCFQQLEQSLKNELRYHQFSTLFDNHRLDIDPTNPFTNPNELLIFLRDLTQDNKQKDRIITALFRLYHQSGNAVWLVFLLLVFLPMIAKLNQTKRSYAEMAYSDDFRQDVLLCFLRAVQNVNPVLRDTQLAGKVKNDTRKGLFESYETIWRTNSTFVSLENEPTEQSANNTCQDDVSRMDRLIDLSSCLQAGIIAERDYQLIVSCEVEGYSLRELAEREGIAYETLKKRKTRAIQAIRIYFDDNL